MSIDDDKTILGPGDGGEEPASLEPSRLLGDYRIVRRLGAGAMGEVYEAEQVHLGSRYAVKVLPAALSADARFRERFRHEARTLASLKHPNIVTIHNAGEADGRFFLVMELLRHFEMPAVERAEDAERIRGILVQILSGLDYAHGKGVVHRDLKPANILHGDDGEVKIGDFGVAQVVGDEFVKTVVQETITRTRMQEASTLAGTAGSDYAGTLQYMAPEVLEGQPATRQSDLYAVGVMAYECLTGRKPAGRYKNASEVVPGLDPAWDAWIDALMQQDAEDRPASAEEAMERLPDGAGSPPETKGRTATGKPLTVATWDRMHHGFRVAAGAVTKGIGVTGTVLAYPIRRVYGRRRGGGAGPAEMPPGEKTHETINSANWGACFAGGARVAAVLAVLGMAWIFWEAVPPWHVILILGVLTFLFAWPMAVLLLRGGRLFRRRESRKTGLWWILAPFLLLSVVTVTFGEAPAFALVPVPVAVALLLTAGGKAIIRKWRRRNAEGQRPETKSADGGDRLPEEETGKSLERKRRLWRAVGFVVLLAGSFYAVGSPFPRDRDDLVVDLGNGVTMEFVWIPQLRAWVGKTEVTNAAFRRFRPEHDSEVFLGLRLDGNTQPAVRVSYEDAVAFTEWLSEREELAGNRIRARLLDGDEWTAIAQCGTDRTYPWGDAWPPTRGNYADETYAEEVYRSRADFLQEPIDGYNDGHAVTAPVEESGRNEWGLYGVGGNVWEWSAEQRDADSRVVRGQAWNIGWKTGMGVDRIRVFRMDRREPNIGFRVLVE